MKKLEGMTKTIWERMQTAGTGGRRNGRKRKKEKEKTRLESKEIQRTRSRLGSSELYRRVWWRLTNILGNIVKSRGDFPTFWVIS